MTKKNNKNTKEQIQEIQEQDQDQNLEILGSNEDLTNIVEGDFNLNLEKFLQKESEQFTLFKEFEQNHLFLSVKHDVKNIHLASLALINLTGQINELCYLHNLISHNDGKAVLLRNKTTLSEEELTAEDLKYEFIDTLTLLLLHVYHMLGEANHDKFKHLQPFFEAEIERYKDLKLTFQFSQKEGNLNSFIYANNISLNKTIGDFVYLINKLNNVLENNDVKEEHVKDVLFNFMTNLILFCKCWDISINELVSFYFYQNEQYSN